MGRPPCLRPREIPSGNGKVCSDCIVVAAIDPASLLSDIDPYRERKVQIYTMPSFWPSGELYAIARQNS
jgi:hypothetical protein